MANAHGIEYPYDFSAGSHPSERYSHWILRSAIVAAQLGDHRDYLPSLQNIADLDIASTDPTSMAMLGELGGALLLLLGGTLNRLGCDLCTRVGAAAMLIAVILMSGGFAPALFDNAMSSGAVRDIAHPQTLTPLALAYVLFRGRHI